MLFSIEGVNPIPRLQTVSTVHAHCLKLELTYMHIRLGLKPYLAYIFACNVVCKALRVAYHLES